jgi:hypothetical protein
VPTAAGSSSSPPASRISSRSASSASRVAAHHAEPRASSRAAARAIPPVAAGTPVADTPLAERARCSRRPAPAVDASPGSRSSRPAPSPSTAATASRHSGRATASWPARSELARGRRVGPIRRSLSFDGGVAHPRPCRPVAGNGTHRDSSSRGWSGRGACYDVSTPRLGTMLRVVAPFSNRPCACHPCSGSQGGH